jgi:soluble lytic murein transglycosylase-like protein
MAAARDEFEAIASGWRPALETLLETQPAQDQAASSEKVRALRAFLDKYPQGYYSQLAVFMLALHYYETGYADETVKILGRAGHLPAVDAYAAALHGMALLRLQKYGEISRLAGEYMAAHPGSRAAYELVIISAEAMSRQGDSRAALDMLEDAARDDDAPPVSRGRTYAAMARTHKQLGRPDMAAQALARIGAEYPRADVNLDFAALTAAYADGVIPQSLPLQDRLALGRYLMVKEKFALAADLLGKGLPANADPALLSLAGEAAYRAGRYSDAAGFLEKARSGARDPDTMSRSCAFLGMALRKRAKKNDTNTALKELESCARNASRNKGLLYSALADLYEVMDSPKSAVGALEKLAAADPAHSEDHMHRLARHYLLNGRADAAFRTFDALLKSIPDGKYADDAAFWAARLAMRGGRSAEAVTRFQALRRDYPYSYFADRAPEYLRQLGAKPEPDWRQGAGAASFPRIRSEAVKFGYALMDMGYYEQAETEFRFALGGGEDEADAAGVGLARLMRARGEMIPSVKAIELRAMRRPAFHNLVMTHTAYRELLYPTLYADEVRLAATAHGVPPALALAVIRQESRFEAKATSRSNAKGLMQIIPSTGKWIAGKRGISGFSVEQLYEVRRNVDFGNWYIREMLNVHGGDKHLAVAAYNGGPGNVRKWRAQFGATDADLFTEHIPRDETRDYVTKVMHNWFVYDYLLAN